MPPDAEYVENLTALLVPVPVHTRIGKRLQDSRADRKVQPSTDVRLRTLRIYHLQ